MSATATAYGQAIYGQATAAGSPDPGPRGGPAAAGGPLAGLSGLQIAYFNAARTRFMEVDSVTGSLPGEPGVGLGPRFNGNGCAQCHAYPAAGGSSPPLNPLISIARAHGAGNVVPSFLTRHGPVRVARFVHKPNGMPDGAVHPLFVITGRTDAPGCRIAQPDFVAALADNNIGLRIPAPLFGLGLVESVSEFNLRAAFAAAAELRGRLGIGGHFNTNPNDDTITRFGWKAQDKSLLLFAAEAYNVEIGVTNEIFPNEIDTTPACSFNATPEDVTNLIPADSSGNEASDYASDIVNFAAFARLSAPPAAQQLDDTGRLGQAVFKSIGCQACHIIAQTTGAPGHAGGGVTFQPYSDFALHAMGRGLADGIEQGSATGDEFRTAPLWGLGQRLFFLHDGRTADLDAAVRAHASDGSEANRVIAAYAALPPEAVRALLIFLRSL